MEMETVLCYNIRGFNYLGVCVHVNQTFIDIQWVTTLTALPHACHNYACAHS